MKRRYLLFGLMGILMALATACSESEDVVNVDNMVRIHLSKTQTKGFLENAAKTESYEQSLSSISVFVYEATGSQNLLLRHDASASELQNSKLVFLLPRGMEKKTVSFVAIANLSVATAPATLADAFELLEEDCEAYNGTFEQVTAGALRSGGFVMSSLAKDVTISANGATEVFMPMERTVAKIAVKTTISNTFSQKYSGSVKVTKVTLKNVSSKTRVFKPSLTGTSASENELFEHKQNIKRVNEEFDALFFSFEKLSTKPMIVIDGIYDADGNELTKTDQSNVSYSFQMNDFVSRNSYYSISVQIDGLDGSECNMTLSIKDWAGPYSQNVTIGK